MRREDPAEHERMVEGVRGRNWVHEHVQQDPTAALSAARKIQHPWYRCQALSQVAEYCADKAMKLLILQEALQAARSQSEPNRTIVVSAWPLSIMVTAFQKEALEVAYELLALSETEQHGLRRLDAQASLIQSVMQLSKARELLLPKFEETAMRSHGWRSDKLVAWVAITIARYDGDAAWRLVQSRPANRFSKAAAKQIESTRSIV